MNIFNTINPNSFMQTYIAIFRGMNVSGKNLVKMVELKILFESLGFTDVRTYIQSGNVIFNVAETDVHLLSNKIHESVLGRIGMDVPVFVLTEAELNWVKENNPFINDPDLDLKSLYVTFLWEVPEVELVENLPNSDSFKDHYQVVDKIIFLKMEGGYGKTKLNSTFFEKKLKTVATTRNWNAILKLGGYLPSN